MLSLESLTVARGGRPIIDTLSLQLPAGQIVGLIGANGADLIQRWRREESC